MKNNLVITVKDSIVYYGYYKDGTPVELYCEPKEQTDILGNIYAAKVERVAEGIGGAFLGIADGRSCYFPFKGSDKPVKLSRGHEDGLYGGDVILVQVVKDAVKTKLPVADKNVSLSGKYFVFTLSDKRSGVSKKINDIEIREKLAELTEPYKSEEYGIVIRTNAAKAVQTDRAVLVKELETLKERYEELMRRASFATDRALLYKQPSHYITLMKELPENEVNEIVTDDEDIYQELLSYQKEHKDFLSKENIRFYTDSYSLSKLYRMEHHYEKARQKLVWLKSGGSIVIEQTEAMVVIDVNSGSVLKGKKKSEEIYYQMNCEAAEEIVRQLRLRNLSGIILIDFINMHKQEQKDSLVKLLKKECRKDRISSRVVDMTALNLVEMTRNKVRRPLHEQWKNCRDGNKKE